MILYLFDVDQFSVEGARRACARVLDGGMALGMHSGQSKEKVRILERFDTNGVCSVLVSPMREVAIEMAVSNVEYRLAALTRAVEKVVIVSSDKKLLVEMVKRCKDLGVLFEVEDSGQYEGVSLIRD